MLSIVIPTLKEKKNLGNLLKSLKEQAFKDFEVIVADAGSKDGTVETALEYGAKVVKGGKPGPGRNAGAKAATGDLIFFFDADVVLTPDFLERTLKRFKDKNLDVASFFVTPISDKRIDKFSHDMINVFYSATQRVLPHAPGSCILVKKETHEKIGGFDEKIFFAEDQDYVNRASKVGKYRFLSEPKFSVSVRRLEKDGRLNTAMKYLLAEAYIIFVGEIKTDIFRYDFAHYDQVAKEKIKQKLREKFLSLAKESLPTPRPRMIKLYNNLVESLKRNNSK